MSISTVALYIENDQEWSNDTFEEIIGDYLSSFRKKRENFVFGVIDKLLFMGNFS
ncbi:hypothetical protein SAMN04489761_2354 [Tenacibaculum sp. MAR_2009_124]|uniref:hypothetical protein n=1 Tax=Tenacibaculum sp. MAR_2009_124 TaxID=1250059 RepID=UPI00089CF2D5|nr:hypothetical protein [Tenacibaculum sp. MAR_2009_124]SEC19824.1 hypothetical protein SAMN04489761_2354 [Tenacibaculum sp. MAR_2009_124]